MHLCIILNMHLFIMLPHCSVFLSWPKKLFGLVARFQLSVEFNKCSMTQSHKAIAKRKFVY
uniref:Uncharacterized protein n=1 Tax=Arundo donax TaxID=35708 RepID=A0A0A8Y8H0_ARUDO